MMLVAVFQLNGALPSDPHFPTVFCRDDPPEASKPAYDDPNHYYILLLSLASRVTLGRPAARVSSQTAFMLVAFGIRCCIWLGAKHGVSDLAFNQHKDGWQSWYLPHRSDERLHRNRYFALETY